MPTADAGALFAEGSRWADMDAWHEEVAQIRRSSPVLCVDKAGFDPFWVLTRHADVFEISRDDEHWLNTPRSVLGPNESWARMVSSGIPLPATLVHLDGRQHRLHRQVANDWFKPASVGKRQGRIDELADVFIERMRQRGGRCDFARDVAAPFTLRVIMDIYGVPEEDEPLMLDLTQGIFGAADPEFLGTAANPDDRVLETIMRFVQYFDAITKDRQDCPRDDLASVIANGKIEGSPLGLEQRLWYYIIVATAGHDTTSYALSGGMEAMLRDPSQLWALRDDPGLVGNAAEEVIRWTSPVRHFLRYATEDTEVHGTAIPEGGRVLLSYPSANRDEDVFVDPMSFDVRRHDAGKLLSFGVGAHFCLGSQFARREIRTMLAKLSQQLVAIEPDGEAEWARSSFVSGVKHLPVAYRFR